MSTPEKDSRQRSARPWRVGIRRWWAPVIVGLVVVLGGAGVIALLNMPNKDAPPIDPSSTTAPTKPSAPSADGCDAPAGEMTAAPDDLEWKAASGITWPVSRSLGPTSVKDGWSVCFSHSPVGAALAASTIAVGSFDHDMKELVEFWAVESAGKSEAIALSEDGSSEAVVQSMKAKGMQLAGYRVDDYDESRATITLTFSLPGSQTDYVGLPVTVVWVDGDWRLRLLDSGSLTGQSFPVNAGQFTEWAPRG